MSNNKIYFFCIVFLLLAVFSTEAQDCTFIVKGYVIDKGTNVPLSYVNVFIQETSEGTITDDDGYFELDSICAGHFHFIFSHIGCDSEKFHLDIDRDTSINILLEHTSTSLGTVVVEGKKDNSLNQANLSVNRQAIEDNSNKNLSGLLENETGVHLIKNGSGISKPIVHGLYGNRLTILNNGIEQSGQQWGNDHSPEIDPFSADKITVIKGANAIEYGNNLGSVILVEPKRINREPHLHGQVNQAFESNGRGIILNSRLEQYAPKLAWRISGTLKKYGDRKTADYFLNNTGTEEANLSIQLEKSWNEKFFLDFYASTFNTNLGVLRGSHISNLTDLEAALNRDIPFYTEPNFSYSLDAPKQKVSHHLAKIKVKYFLEKNQIVEIVAATQINQRKEFDIRRGERSDIPALDLNQFTINADFKYSKEFGQEWKFKIGNQTIITDNTNSPETGILPLIPDYLSWENGLFATLSKSKDKSHFNLGIRYDYEYQSVVAISNTVPKEILRYSNQFHNLASLVSIKYDIAENQFISLNSGFAMRNPGINERYSNGLHQGVSGIEEGDVNLQTERSTKNTLEYNWFLSSNFSFNALAYHQYFKDYIFLNPQDEIRLTIRGAFPVFKYEQTDAHIYGLDLSTQFTIKNALFGKLKYSYLRGQDLKNKTPLIYMPPNRFFGSLTYRIKKPLKISTKLKMEELEFEINNRLVLEQKNILPEQDFASPPPAYNLLGMKVSTNIILTNYKFRFFIKADNLLNTEYRDYLNRQRYFADDLGISITVGLNFKF